MRAATRVQEYGGYVLEMLMKGKWHAKINLNKTAAAGRRQRGAPRLGDGELFTDSLLFASLSLRSTPGIVHLRTGGLTKTLNPDPKQQSMKVLCPVATKKRLLLMVKSYYVLLLAQQADGSLPIDSAIVQELIPLLHSKLAKLPGEKGWNHVLNAARAAAAQGDASKVLLFGAEEWSRYTMECCDLHAGLELALSLGGGAREGGQAEGGLRVGQPDHLAAGRAGLPQRAQPAELGQHARQHAPRLRAQLPHPLPH